MSSKLAGWLDRHRFTDGERTANLAGNSVRGGAVTLVAQCLKIGVRIGSMAVIARMVSPADYGLVAMVTSVTGVVAVFRDGGLGFATIQRPNITHEQVSTLFWINLFLGAGFALVLLGAAPLLAAFYREPRLTLVTFVLAVGSLLDGFSVQPQALLRRQMRFGAIATIEIASLVFSAGVGIWLAMAGWGYWALVGMALASPLTSAIGVSLALQWWPGFPRRQVGARSMLAFGGHLTARSLLIYLSRNVDNFLIGWASGPAALGLYSRAYQLLLFPIEQIHSTALAGE